jgi:hypothetical protein
VCGEPNSCPSSGANTSTSQICEGIARSKLPKTWETPYPKDALQSTFTYAMPPWTGFPETMCTRSRGVPVMFAFQYVRSSESEPLVSAAVQGSVVFHRRMYEKTRFAETSFS